MQARAVAFFLLVTPACPVALAEASPCDDVAYARNFKAHYPDEVNRLFDTEHKQQVAWTARARAISERVVAVGAATRDAQDALVEALSKSPQITALDQRAQDSANDFRLRNNTLQATPVLALIDPFRPNRAWCMLAKQALDSLNAKVNAEIESWSLLDRALLDSAASRGVRFVN